MLYAANLYCPCDTENLHVYDEEIWRPCIGLCGHTVCSECIEENVNMACPICNQPDVFVNKTPNYAAIELVNDCRNNFWQLMKNWWSGENIDSGPCSRCSEQCVLRICLTCDEDNLCNFLNTERRLKMDKDRDLLKLSRRVLCSECAINHHNGHQTINIKKIKYSKQDIRKATSKAILELFWLEMCVKELSHEVKCRMREKWIQSIGLRIRDKLMFLEMNYSEEGECGYLVELITKELITKYMEYIDRKREELRLFSLGETPCECNRLYNALKSTQTEVDYDIIFSEICESGIGMFSPGCPLFLKSQLENRLKLYEILGETPPEQVTPEPYNVIQCSLCVILDHSEHKKEHHRQNWLEIVENIWKNELSLSNSCCRCLRRLDTHRIGRSCKQWDGNLKGENYDYDQHNDGLFLFPSSPLSLFLNSHVRNPCHKPDCLMKDPELWKYHIIFEVRVHLACIMRQGCLHQSFSCQLKKIRLESLALAVHRALCKMNLRKKSREEFNLILKKVDDAFEQLRNRKTIYEAEIQGPKCECSKLWNENQKILKKLVKESSAKQKPYLKFKRSMERMAKFLFKKEIPGCPMDFGHGIVLEPIVLEELRGMDLEDSFENMDLNSDSDSDSDEDPCLYNSML